MWSELESQFQKSLADSVRENLGLHGYPAASNKQINKRVKVTLLIIHVYETIHYLNSDCYRIITPVEGLLS